MIDNLQGHSMYSKDTLVSSRMNLHPGGKQARMKDGWFTQNGQKAVQPMIFLANHPESPGQPKGIKQVFQECSLWTDKLKLRC